MTSKTLFVDHENRDGTITADVRAVAPMIACKQIATTNRDSRYLYYLVRDFV